MPTAIIFVAVSSQEQAAQDKVSLSEQERLCREWCAANGYTVLRLLSVPGYSRRESDVISALEDFAAQGIYAYHELRDLWQKPGSFDVLVCYHDSRLGRSSSLYTFVVENTIRSGAQIFRIEGGWIKPEDMRVQIALGHISATTDVDRLLRQHEAGMIKRAQRGLNVPSVPMSHKILRDDRGQAIRLVPNETKRRLFDDLAGLLLAGESWHNTSHLLYTQFGHTNTANKQIAGGVLYRVLHTPIFWGNNAIKFNRKTIGWQGGLWAFDPSEPAPDGVLVFYHTHEAMYIGDLAASVQAELRRRPDMIGTRRPNQTNRLAGLVLCGECGRSMTIQHQFGLTYFRCRSRDHHRKNASFPDCQQYHMIREEVVFAFLDRALRQMMAAADPALFLADDAPPDVTAPLSALAGEIADTEARIRRLITAQAAADGDMYAFYADEIATLGDKLKILRARHADLQRQSSTTRQQDRQIAYDRLAALTVDTFWQQDNVTVNQLLRRLMGSRRIVVLDGAIIGTAAAS